MRILRTHVQDWIDSHVSGSTWREDIETWLEENCDAEEGLTKEKTISLILDSLGTYQFNNA